MSDDGFDEVLDWIREEREYQQLKFNYEAEEATKTEDHEYWLKRFADYEQRLPLFGLDTAPGIQAALKLAATVLAMCEHLADRYELPMPGRPSGYLE